MSRAVQLQVQNQWTRWLNFIQQDFSWATLMAMPTNLTSFCLASTLDTLPLPTNLQRGEYFIQISGCATFRIIDKMLVC